MDWLIFQPARSFAGLNVFTSKMEKQPHPLVGDGSSHRQSHRHVSRAAKKPYRHRPNRVRGLVEGSATIKTAQNNSTPE